MCHAYRFASGRVLTFVSFALGCLCASCAVKTGQPLVTGRTITPQTQPAGAIEPTGQDVGSMPVNMILSPDGRFAVSTDVGFRQALWAIDVHNGRGVAHLEYANRRRLYAVGGEAQQGSTEARPRKANGLYYGLAFADDGTLYAAQGALDSIAVLHLDDDGKLVAQRAIGTQAHDFPAAVAIDGRGVLFVSNQSLGGDNPFKSPGSVAAYDAKSGKELGRYRFIDSYFDTTNYPLAIAARRDGSRVYVASERDSAVYVLDGADPANLRLVAKVAVGELPQGAILSPNESRLYVADSGSDSVSVIDTAANRVVQTILLRPPVARDLPGCTPNGLALAPDGTTLYVTLSDFNAIALVDLKSASVRGYIPTGWYPTGIVATPDGRHLLVASAKGIQTRVPNLKIDPETGRRRQAGSPLNLLEGHVQLLALPDREGLEDDTGQVLKNNRLQDDSAIRANPLADIGVHSGRITHVIYIIKENRTYDQVFGDLPRGNGAPDLVMFGRDVTPNQHALAERFGLLDNLYACGEVSGDGWCWSTQAMANANVSRNVPYNYSGRGRKFDFEGQNNGLPAGGSPATDDDGKPLSTNPLFRAGSPTMPDVAEAPGGHLWDLCAKRGISFRNYGMFSYMADDASGTIGGPDNYPTAVGLRPAGHDLAGVTDLDYRRFDLNYADSDGPQQLYEQTHDVSCLYPMRTYGRHQAPSRFSEWNREFQEMLARDPSGGAVPQLMFIRLPKDHTMGGRSDSHSPRSMVADNDYAVGQFVQAVSHSPIWKHSAIFIIEDDAQSGADHVDAHRTVGLVVSPYLPGVLPGGRVDHHFYNTNSFLRTMQLLLDLPPMTQYDATATPIAGWTRQPSNAAPFAAILPARAIIAEHNPDEDSLRDGDRRKLLIEACDKMDFDHADAAPAEEVNAIVWKLTRGLDVPVPAPKFACPFYQRPDPD